MIKHRVYQPRMVGGKVMLQADLERLHKYMREIESVDHISDEMARGGRKRVARTGLQAAAEGNVTALLLKRASTSRPSGEWKDDDFDVLAEGAVVGRIMKVHAAPVGSPWMWTLAFGQHEDRTPTHGYEPTREAAMAAFAKSWQRQ